MESSTLLSLTVFTCMVSLRIVGALTGNRGRCGGVQVCLFAQNGDVQAISCCMQNPAECRWSSEGIPEANVSFREEPSGLVLRWQPGRDPFGQYDCRNQLNETEAEVLFLPESEFSTFMHNCRIFQDLAESH